MQLEAHLHVVGWLWRGGSWKAGSLDGIPPLVMQLEAQLHVVRWEWDGREMECWELRKSAVGYAAVGAAARRGSGGGGSWNAGSFIKPVMLPPV